MALLQYNFNKHPCKSQILMYGQKNKFIFYELKDKGQLLVLFTIKEDQQLAFFYYIY